MDREPAPIPEAPSLDRLHRKLADVNGFITSLTRAATEMARWRAMLGQDDSPAMDHSTSSSAR